MGILVNVERSGDTYTMTIIVPRRKDGRGPHTVAMQRIMDAAFAVNLEAFDPEPVNTGVESREVNPAVEIAHRDGHTADGGGVIPHSVAEAMMRDSVPPEDDEGEEVGLYGHGIPGCSTCGED